MTAVEILRIAFILGLVTILLVIPRACCHLTDHFSGRGISWDSAVSMLDSRRAFLLVSDGGLNLSGRAWISDDFGSFGDYDHVEDCPVKLLDLPESYQSVILPLRYVFCFGVRGIASKHPFWSVWRYADGKSGTNTKITIEESPNFSESEPVIALWNFFDEMSRWELFAHKLLAESRFDGHSVAQADLAEIFDRLTHVSCPNRGRLRSGIYAVPPEYARNRWDVIGLIQNDAHSAVVLLEEQMSVRASFKMRQVSGNWLVESRCYDFSTEGVDL